MPCAAAASARDVPSSTAASASNRHDTRPSRLRSATCRNFAALKSFRVIETARLIVRSQRPAPGKRIRQTSESGSLRVSSFGGWYETEPIHRHVHGLHEVSSVLHRREGVRRWQPNSTSQPRRQPRRQGHCNCVVGVGNGAADPVQHSQPSISFGILPSWSQNKICA